MGAWISLPAFSPARTSGMSASPAHSAVMSTGRNRPTPASQAEVNGSCPCRRLFRAKVTTSTEFAVATPRLMIAPINAGTLNVVNVR